MCATRTAHREIGVSRGLVDHQAGDAYDQSGYSQDDAEEPEDFFARKQGDGGDHQRGFEQDLREILAIGASFFDFYLGFLSAGFRFDFFQLFGVSVDFLLVLFLDCFHLLGVLKRENGNLVEE